MVFDFGLGGSTTGPVNRQPQEQVSQDSNSVNQNSHSGDFWVPSANGGFYTPNPDMFPPMRPMTTGPAATPWATSQFPRNQGNHRSNLSFDPSTNTLQPSRPRNVQPKSSNNVTQINPSINPSIAPTLPAGFIPPLPPQAPPSPPAEPYQEFLDRIVASELPASATQNINSANQANNFNYEYNNARSLITENPPSVQRNSAPTSSENHQLSHKQHYTEEQRLYDLRLDEESVSLDREKSSAHNVCKKENYPSYLPNGDRDFTTFIEDIELLFHGDGIAHYLNENFVPAELQEEEYRDDHNIFRRARDLLEKKKRNLRKKIDLQNIHLSRLQSLFLAMFSEPRAQNLLRTLPRGTLPFDKLGCIKRLYNQVTLIQEAKELAAVHSTTRQPGEPIDEFVYRLERDCHFISTHRGYRVDDKIKVGILHNSVRGPLSILFKTVASKEPQPSYEQLRTLVIENKGIDTNNYEPSFAGYAKFQNHNRFNSRSRSSSPFNGSHSKSPERSRQAAMFHVYSKDRGYDGPQFTRHDYRSKYYKFSNAETPRYIGDKNKREDRDERGRSRERSRGDSPRSRSCNDSNEDHRDRSPSGFRGSRERPKSPRDCFGNRVPRFEMGPSEADKFIDKQFQ